MSIRRRLILAAPVPFLFLTKAGFAEETDQQIALNNPEEYILAASFDEAHKRNDAIPPQSLNVKPPAYPPLPRNTGVEGWVRVRMTVLTDGTVRNPQVDDSYPKKVFDEASLRAARDWVFTPALVNGQPRETRGHRLNITYMLDGPRGVTRDTYGLMSKVLVGFRKRQPDLVEEQLNKLRELRDKGTFNLTEFARFNEMSAQLAYERQRWIESNEYLQAALGLGTLLDNAGALEDAYRLQIVLNVRLGKFDQAVDYFDAVRKIYPKTGPVLAEIAEGLRSNGYGKGVAYKIMKLKKADT